MKTGIELAEYALSKLGTPYFYGAKMHVLTEKFMKTMHNMYPSTVTDNYIAKARSKVMVGKECVDCSGLIGAYREKQIGSSQLYSTAKKRLPISQISDFAIGTVLWKQGHVGVCVGNGYCVEAKGIDYGVVKTKVSDTKWQYGLVFDDMEYSYEKTIQGAGKTNNPYKEPIATIRKTARGEGVKWIQWELQEAGYDIKIDGIFGKNTEKYVKAFQQSCKITCDGIVGRITRQNLNNF